MEEDITAEEKLKQLNEERKTLRVQVKDERTLRLEKAAEMRVERDADIEEVNLKLNKIQDKIYKYKKLGKVAKSQIDIFGLIFEEINSKDVVADSANN